MDFAGYRRAHAAWKVKLKAFVHGTASEKFSPSEILKEDRNLGQWLGEEAGNAKFAKLWGLHTKFHLIAGAVVEAAVAGQRAQALEMLGPYAEFATLSAEMHKELVLLETA